MYRVSIITLSDTASKGERIDESGRVIAEIVRNEGYEVVFQKIIPDEGAMLEALLCGLADNNEAPEATKRVIERETPGISEAMRYCSLQVTPRGMLSRGVSGIRKDALIVNLPGSPKAVRECLEYAIGALGHGLDILKGSATNCAAK